MYSGKKLKKRRRHVFPLLSPIKIDVSWCCELRMIWIEFRFWIFEPVRLSYCQMSPTDFPPTTHPPHQPQPKSTIYVKLVSRSSRQFKGLYRLRSLDTHPLRKLHQLASGKSLAPIKLYRLFSSFCQKFNIKILWCFCPVELKRLADISLKCQTNVKLLLMKIYTCLWLKWKIRNFPRAPLKISINYRGERAAVKFSENVRVCLHVFRALLLRRQSLAKSLSWL